MAAPVSLADWGSFHVGGREVTIAGQPGREVLFAPGGVPAMVDPNGTYLIGALYAHYMIPTAPQVDMWTSLIFRNTASPAIAT